MGWPWVPSVCWGRAVVQEQEEEGGMAVGTVGVMCGGEGKGIHACIDRDGRRGAIHARTNAQVVPAGGVDLEAAAAQVVEGVLPLLAGGAAHGGRVVVAVVGYYGHGGSGGHKEGGRRD